MAQIYHSYSLTAVLSVVFLLLQACSPSADSGSSQFNPNCNLSSSSWTPNIPGLSASNHDASITVAKDVFQGTAPVVGLDQSYSAGQLITINFSVGSLGPNGSIAITGQTTAFPSDLEGSAYPALISLENTTTGDGDMVKLSAGCSSAGLFQCINGVCNPEASCNPGATSVFKTRDHWQQYQIPPFGTTSMNVFPTCNWDNTTYSSFQCEFNNSYFDNGGTPATATLKAGNYRAKFMMIASNFASIPSATASFKITVTRKTDNRAVANYNNNANGAIDLNVILVGSKNVADSQTTKGQANLDALFRRVYDHYNQDGDFPISAATPTPTTVYGGVGIQIGEINVYEMGCENSSDLEFFANIPASRLGDLFRVGSALVPSSTEGSAMNIFINSFIDNDITGSGTILGVSGGIGGPVVNGTDSSGLVFRSAERLATFNPACGQSSTCADNDQEADFVDMGGTISHEIGHYLGLNHPRRWPPMWTTPLPIRPPV